MTDVFSNDQQIRMDDLVGEGKQFATTDDLVKSWVAGRAHIKTVEEENKAFKQSSSNSTTIEAALAELRKGTNTPQSPAPTSATTQSVLDDNTLKATVEAVIQEKTQAQRQADAKAQVQAALIEKFGTPEKVRSELALKAKELDTTVQELERTAVTSPKMFLQLFNAEQKVVNTGPARSTVNVEARKNEVTPDGNAMSRYTNLIREKGYTYYMSPQVQNEIMAEAMKNPAAFGIKI